MSKLDDHDCGSCGEGCKSKSYEKKKEKERLKKKTDESMYT